MIGDSLRKRVSDEVTDYKSSSLARILNPTGPFAIKFVSSRWAGTYLKASRLKISATPALTWGTATYVTPIAFPLSSALYGRVGLVTDFDPSSWKIFDATLPSSRAAYLAWVQAQPIFQDLILTVHSTHANHYLRNRFRKDFGIDCVLFHPDQEAELHTDKGQHVWMAVTDWTAQREIDSDMSDRLSNARFTVLIDEDFAIEDRGLPIQRAPRQIEGITQQLTPHAAIEVDQGRSDPALPGKVTQSYQNGGYLHMYIKP